MALVNELVPHGQVDPYGFFPVLLVLGGLRIIMTVDPIVKLMLLAKDGEMQCAYRSKVREIVLRCLIVHIVRLI